MSSGINPTGRVEHVAGGYIVYGRDWATGEPTGPERPVWFYGFAEDTADPRFPSIQHTMRLVTMHIDHCRRWYAGPLHAWMWTPLQVARAATGDDTMAHRLIELRGAEIQAALDTAREAAVVLP